jgi:hypothetical protein
MGLWAKITLYFHETGELSSTSRVLDMEESRRADFVDMLLNIDADTISTSQIDDSSAGVTFKDSGFTKDKKSVYEKRDTTMLSRTGKLWFVNANNHLNNIFLKHFSG